MIQARIGVQKPAQNRTWHFIALRATFVWLGAAQSMESFWPDVAEVPD